MSSNHSLVKLYSGGTVAMYKAYGSNDSGQLGNGNTTNSNIPIDISFGEGNTLENNMTLLGSSAGKGHSCLIRNDNVTPFHKIYSFGSNTRGQLGNGTLDNSSYPVEVSGIIYTDYDDNQGGVVSCGENYTLIRLRYDINNTDHLYGMGDNSYGQLGLGDISDRYYATKIESIHNDISQIGIISTGYNHSFVYGGGDPAGDRSTSYKLLGFGRGNYGKLGNGNAIDTSYNTPVDISFYDYSISSDVSEGRVISIACGLDHTAIWYSTSPANENKIATFGRNNYGQLGNGTNTDNVDPQILSDVSTVSDIACGESHTAFIYSVDHGGASYHQVKTFGRNDYGQLGLGDTTNRNVPTIVPDISNAFNIACGQYHTTVLLSNGTIKSFGKNDLGQLGDGTTTNRSSPVFLRKSTGGQKVNPITGISRNLSGISSLSYTQPSIAADHGDPSTIVDGSAIIFTISPGALDASNYRIANEYNTVITSEDIPITDTSYTTPSLSIGTYLYLIEAAYAYPELDMSGNTQTINVVSASAAPCFLAGTRILTPTGYKSIETFKDGDLITTSDRRIVPVILKSTDVYSTTEENAPYIIPKDSIKEGLPCQDVFISPNHAIEAKPKTWLFPKNLAQINKKMIRQIKVGEPVIYYHLETPEYLTDNLVVEGLVAESFGRKYAKKVGYLYSGTAGGYLRIYRDSVTSRNIRLV